MEKKSVFTYVKKYSLIIGILSLVFLAGCQSATVEPLNPESAGFFDKSIVIPFSNLIKWLASIFNDNYGVSIILITLLIRLILMPFFLKQTKSSIHMREKMKVLKPDMNALQEKYKDKTDMESKQKMQQEMMELYQKHDMNPFSTMAGCLPMLLQLPILIGFFYAIRRTPEIATHSFLWFDLGQADIILALSAAAIYFVQFKVSQRNMDENMRKQMAILGLISPLMIGIFSLTAPSALPLYWAVGGLFMIGQTLISQSIYAKTASSN